MRKTIRAMFIYFFPLTGDQNYHKTRRVILIFKTNGPWLRSSHVLTEIWLFVMVSFSGSKFL